MGRMPTDAPAEGRTPRRRRPALAPFLTALALVAGGAAAAAFIVGRVADGRPHALLSPWSFQCWVATLAALGLALLCRGWRTSGLLACLAVWPSVTVLPSLQGRPSAEPTGATFRVVSANVLARARPTEATLAWMRETGPTLLAIVECSDAWSEATARLADILPYRAEAPQPNPGGIALLSALPLRDVRIGLAPGGLLPFIEATVDTPAGATRLLVVHPAAPMTDVLLERRDEEIAFHARRVAERAVPTIVMGDFNETPYGEAYASFVRTSGLRAARDGFGLAPTWPALLRGVEIPSIARIAIDHCFVSDDFDVTNFELGPVTGSDHRPIVVDLSVSDAATGAAALSRR